MANIFGYVDIAVWGLVIAVGAYTLQLLLPSEVRTTYRAEIVHLCGSGATERLRTFLLNLYCQHRNEQNRAAICIC